MLDMQKQTSTTARLPFTHTSAALIALLLAVGPSWGQSQEGTTHWYWWLLDRVQFVEDAAAPAQEPTPPSGLTEDVRQLREEVRELKVTVELYLGSQLASMQEENARLRAEVQRLQSLQGAGGDSQMFVPNPYNRPSRTPDALPGQEPNPASLMPAQESGSSGGTPAYEVVDSWGRSEEDQPGQEEKAPTLKGMIVLVSGDSGKEGLEALGRELYSEFAAFDNINIEVYNDRDSAKAAASGSPPDARHRVLIISKHAASNRKIMIYLGGATPETTPFE